MVHVARRLLGAFVVLAVVAGATLALSSRPRLETDRSAVEREWRAVRLGLDTRYRRVDALARDVDAAGGPPNSIVEEVHTAFAAWNTLPTSGSSVAGAITVANTLEGLSRRLEVTVTSSPLLNGDTTVTGALHEVTIATIPTVAALDAAVSKYENDRGGPLRRLVAGPLGYSAIPRLALANGP